ncbi:MAG: nickel pincer cofactor biosynthesis protein LarC [Deltaproteobacteria bacterium]|nr:nickel pincer cofactor biosynthesis protein LarC [Deltaproteobacteria bacterium]
MKTAYLDCFSGVSGDMFVGALLDGGLSFNELDSMLKTLSVGGYSLQANREDRNHIYGTRFVVKLDNEHGVHRKLKDIRKIIEQGDFSRDVSDKSIEIFETLAKVEGNIHNNPPDDVHFHEVGGIDSIIDIVSAVYGIERLGIERLFVSALPLGSGFVKTAHGEMPLPAPATIALLSGVPVYDSGVRHEMVTPTGAALVKAFAVSFGVMPRMTVESIGYGVGQRVLKDRPNLLRILIGDEPEGLETETVAVLETNLDDTSPELLGFLMDRLFDAGALDVVFCPVQMKKNRPGIQVQVIAVPDSHEKLMEIIFRESTALGVRFRHTQRKVLRRSESYVDSPWGRMKVKKILDSGDCGFFQPEYEECRKIAIRQDMPLREIVAWVMGLNKRP